MTTLPMPGGLFGAPPSSGGVTGFFDDIGTNPLIMLGAGLLSGAGQPSFGAALGQGLQFMSTAQAQQQQNQILRARLANEAREQAAADRRQAALDQLQGLLGPDPNAPVPLTPEGQAAHQQQQLLGLLAEVAPDQFAQTMLSRALPEPEGPTTLQREFEYLVSIGVDPARALESLQKGTVVNVGGDPEEPLSVDDLLKLRDANGNTPPIGTTASQARSLGFTVVSETERQSFEEAASAARILDELEALAVGPDGIFTNVQPGFENRVASALNFGLNLLTQDDPRASQFKDLSEGTLSAFMRHLGNKGALSDSDVERGVGLLPRMFPLPDSGPVAKDKIDQLRAIINKGLNNLNNGIVVTPRTETPPAGGGEADAVPTYRFENGQLVPVR